MNQLIPIDAELKSQQHEPPRGLRTLVAVLRLIPGMRATRLSNRLRLAIHGSVWTLIGFGVSQVLRLVTQLVLAHLLLGPAAFGLVALASVFLSGLETLSDLGIGMDVIHHPRGDDALFVNTAFLIQAGRGMIICALAMAFAGAFASFYHQPQVRLLAIVAAFSIGVRGFASGSVWTMTRHVKLRELTLLSVSGDAVGLAVSLIWVIFSPTAWALVMGRVASAVAFTIGSHLIAEQRATLDWDSSAAKEIFAFGIGILLSSATYFMSGEAERLIVGKFITVAELGCFSLALTLASAPSQALSQVVGQVFYPMIAHSIREDPATAANHFMKARVVFLVISIVLGVGFIAYGPKIVSILLPAKFAMTGWMLSWLGFRAAQQVFVAPTTSLIFAHGDTKYSAMANSVRLFLMAAGLWFAFTRFGIHEAVAVLAISSAAAYFVLIPGLIRHQPGAVCFELLGFALFLACASLAAVIPFPWHSVR